MSVFDQRGQHVTYQYNAAGNINFGAVQNTADLATQLDALKQEITKAREGNAIDEDTEALAKAPLIQAAKEAAKPEPDKPTLLKYLETVKDILKDTVAVGGIVQAATKAYEWVATML